MLMAPGTHRRELEGLALLQLKSAKGSGKGFCLVLARNQLEVGCV